MDIIEFPPANLGPLPKTMGCPIGVHLIHLCAGILATVAAIVQLAFTATLAHRAQFDPGHHLF